MTKAISRKATNVYMISESILNLFALPLGLASVGMSLSLMTQMMATEMETLNLSGEEAEAIESLHEIYSVETAALVTILFFLMIAATRAVKGFRLRKEKGEGFFRLSLVQAAVFAACGVLLLILGYSMESTTIVSVLSAAALIAGRIFSIVRDHRVRNIIPNLIMAGIAGYCAVSYVLMGSLLFLLSVFALMAIVFSRISFSVLKKIVVKTHAAEIIFGLVLLIVTFSLLLTFFEPNMGSFPDALWYCFAIVTTIGFGDLTAVTTFGRVLSVILGAYGIIVVALITSIIVNFYGEMKASPEEGSDDEPAEEAAEN